MNTLARTKILKPASASVDALELKVAEAFVDLESHSSELKTDMKSLGFYDVKNIELDSGRQVLLLHVPVPQFKSYRKIHTKLVRELEKKFSDKHVLIVARRQIVAKPKRGAQSKLPRKRSRTLTSVHECLLEDLVAPSEIIGKRIRVKQDGTRLLKVHLDAKDRNAMEYKLDTFASIYHKLTGKNVAFEFPLYE